MSLGHALRKPVESLLRRLWFSDAPGIGLRILRGALAPLSALTGIVATRRRARILFLPATARPVVVVGNFVAGGAGKTPLVAALACALVERGWQPGIVASGYGAQRDDARLVTADADPAEHGDEPVLLARSTGRPVAAARNRAAAVTALVAAHPAIDVVLSDDGLQHTALARSIELAVFDERGVGNGLLLPAGPLRAPIACAASMDALVLNGDAQSPIAHARQFRFHIEALRFVAIDGHEAPLSTAAFVDRIGAGKVTAIAATGAPQRFFDTLFALGLRPHCIALPDHAVLDARAMKAIRSTWIVMTAKDAVKCAGWADDRCWALEVRAVPEARLIDWLIEAIRGRTSA